MPHLGNEQNTLFDSAEVDGHGISDPVFLDTHRFIITHIQRQWPPKVSVQLFEINPGDLTPHRLRLFLLPPMRGCFILDSTYCVSQMMAATSPKISSHCGSTNFPPASRQHDLESLVEIVFSLYPVDDPLRHSYSFFIYPSILLAAVETEVDNEVGELPWESWGAENSACFTDVFDRRPGAALGDGCGDRVLLGSQKALDDSGVSEYRLYMLDFRPERVRRAKLISLGQTVWPPNPQPTSSDFNTYVSKSRTPKRGHQNTDKDLNWEMYAFVDGPIQCNLPFIEFSLIDDIKALHIYAEMDDQHTVLNKARQIPSISLSADACSQIQRYRE